MEPGRTDEKSRAERAAALLMHPLNAVLIGEMAEAAGKHRPSCIDVLTGPLLSVTPRGAGTVRGRVSGCHRPGRPLVRCVRIRRGVSTVQPGQSIGADFSLPSAMVGNAAVGPLCTLLYHLAQCISSTGTNELLLLRGQHRRVTPLLN